MDRPIGAPTLENAWPPMQETYGLKPECELPEASMKA